MSDNSATTAQSVEATVEFGISGATVRAKLMVPTGPTRVSEMLDTCRALAGVIVDTAVEQVEASGERVTCKAGCGACCRQPVPVSEAEARMLAALVDAMPEPRRAAVLERFAAARKIVEDAGLLEMLADVDRFPYSDAQSFAHQYFALGIPCPFLENESCSIYPDRPLICREYLVTSPAEHCANPTPSRIRMVPLSTRTSKALISLGMKPGDTHGRWVPLILALEWAAAQPEETSEMTGPELLQEFFTRLFEGGMKAPHPAEAAAEPRCATS